MYPYKRPYTPRLRYTPSYNDLPRKWKESPSRNKELPLPRVGVLLKNKTHVLLVQTKGADRWGLPKGSREPNETLRHTGTRELYEETGFTLKDFTVIHESYHRRFVHHLFIYQIDQDHLPIPIPIDTNEIGDARWFVIETLHKKMLNYFTKFMFNDIINRFA